MPALRGYENVDLGGSLRFDNYADESLRAPAWTESQTHNLRYILVRVSEVAEKHSKLNSEGLLEKYEFLRSFGGTQTLDTVMRNRPSSKKEKLKSYLRGDQKKWNEKRKQMYKKGSW